MTYIRLAGARDRAGSLVCRLRSRAGIDESVGEATQWCFNHFRRPIDSSNHYRLNGTFDPTTSELGITGTLSIIADAPTDRIDLLLNKGLWLYYVFCGQRCSITTERQIGEETSGVPLQRLTLKPDIPLGKGDRLGVSFVYRGILRGQSGQEAARSSLATSAHWFPLRVSEPKMSLSVALELPSGFALRSPAQNAGVERPGTWLVEMDSDQAQSISFQRLP